MRYAGQACDAARQALPTATTTTVGIYASGQAVESLIMHLQSNPLREAQDIGRYLLDECRKVIPMFLERAMSSVAELTQLIAPTLLTPLRHWPKRSEVITVLIPVSQITLVDYWPRNEPRPSSGAHALRTQPLPLKTFRGKVAGWPYDKKQISFRCLHGRTLKPPPQARPCTRKGTL